MKFKIVIFAISASSVFASWIDEQVLLPSQLEAGDNFGKTVTMYADKMAVASTGDDDGGNNAGAVYTYQWNTTHWVEDEVVLRPVELGDSDTFGSSISMYGDKLAVGAYFDDTVNSNAGAVYTFQWNTTHWVQDDVILAPSQLAADDWFGASVSMSGDKMAVGANGNTGAVYTYQWNTTHWVQDDEVILPISVSSGDAFGFSLSMDGNHLVVGARNKEVEGAAGAGTAYTFEWNTTHWEQIDVLEPITLGAGHQFGYSVSVHSDRLSVGAVGTDSGAGAVYTYQWNGSAWVQDTVTLKPSDLEANDNFGVSVFMYQEHLVVGATGDDGVDSNAGAVYAYQWNTTHWVEDLIVVRPAGLAADDTFGSSVTVYGDNMAVGATGDDSSGSAAGIVYTFNFVPPTPQPTNSPTTSPTSNPTESPTTGSPTVSPTSNPTASPTTSPTNNPTEAPTELTCPTCINGGRCVNFACECPYPYYGVTCDQMVDCLCTEV